MALDGLAIAGGRTILRDADSSNATRQGQRRRRFPYIEAVRHAVERGAALPVVDTAQPFRLEERSVLMSSMDAEIIIVGTDRRVVITALRERHSPFNSN